MDDPWGSPWAADSTTPTIDLPAAPPHAHFITAGNHNNTAKRGSLSPWDDAGENDNDAWGGWNDAQSGRGSPGWGRSPSLRPASGHATRDVSPDPWGTAKVVDTKRDEQDRAVLDSAISLGDDLRLNDPVDSKPEPGLDAIAHDAWTTKEETPLPETTATPTIELTERPETPEPSEGPPGKAIGAEARPDPVRQSSKVQELVEMYDDIAKQSTSPIETPTPRDKSPAARREEGEENITKFGETDDTETTDGDTDNEAPVSKIQELDEDSGLGYETVQAVEEDETTVPENEPQRHGPEPSGLTPESYSVDPSKYDELFPTTPATAPNPEPVPDVIIDDTFASISERKAWYRLSRFGSMRKHNLGDDEGYVRVTWTKSEVRDKTIRIVRRWMEEDSIAGRVVLGRRTGAVGATMFGWDSSAPQVDVKELLGKKGRHSRHTSQASKGTTASPTVAAFGWSSSLPASPTVADTMSSRPSEEKTNGLGKPPADPPASSVARLSIQPPARPQSLGQALAPPSIPAVVPTSTAPEEEDDDDDWGEMVSSPTFPVSQSAEPTAPQETVTNGISSQSNTPPTVALKEDAQPPFPHVDQNIPAPQPDPWGSVNLDWFEGGSKPKSHPVQPPSITSPAAIQAVDSPHVTTTSNLPLIPSSTPEATTNVAPKEHNDAHEEKIVAEILRGLPDLGYMFR